MRLSLKDCVAIILRKEELMVLALGLWGLWGVCMVLELGGRGKGKLGYGETRGEWDRGCCYCCIVVGR